MISLTIPTLCSLASTRSFGADPPKLDVRRAEVKEGGKVPFTGVLFTPAALAKLVTELESDVGKIKLELEAEREKTKARLEKLTAIHAAEVAAERAKYEALRRDLDRQKLIYEKALDGASASPPWYKSRYLAFITGALISGGVCTGVSAAR